MAGNCARIRRAFVLGARTLRNILHAEEADVSKELDQFFKNCNLRYHGSKQRPDVGPPSRSSQGKIIPNGVQKMGGAKRSDMAKTEDVVASGREENTNESSTRSLTSVPSDEGALNFRETKTAVLNGSNGLLSHDSRHIDEGPIRGDATVSSTRNQQSTNGSTSPCSKHDSEEDEESSSQSSWKGEPMTASENATVLGVPDTKRGNLLSCQPGNLVSKLDYSLCDDFVSSFSNFFLILVSMYMSVLGRRLGSTV